MDAMSIPAQMERIFKQASMDDAEREARHEMERLRNSSGGEAARKSAKQREKERNEQALSFLREHGEATTDELAADMGLSRGGARWTANRLLREGIIEFVGFKNKAVVWAMVDKDG